MKSIFSSAPDENGVAFSETFPSNICCLLTVICYHLGRVYSPLQPARNMKFASGSLDFILRYFSVFSEEKSFSCYSLLSAGSSLVLPSRSLTSPQHFSCCCEIFVFLTLQLKQRLPASHRGDVFGVLQGVESKVVQD